MTPLRERMIRELELHRKSPLTVDAYVKAVAQLAQYHGRSPDAISVEEVRNFLHYLITQKKVAFSTCNQRLAAIRFFYRHVLGQEDFSLRVPSKRGARLPEPFSRGEIAKILDATRNLKHRALLMTAYGGGLRVSELVRRHGRPPRVVPGLWLRAVHVPAEEFLHRFLQHVLPDRFLRIRHYGLLANRGKHQRLARCPVVAGTKPAQRPGVLKPRFCARQSHPTA